MTTLVILLWLAGDWREYRVPLTSERCRETQLMWHRTPDEDKPKNVLIWCEKENAK